MRIKPLHGSHSEELQQQACGLNQGSAQLILHNSQQNANAQHWQKYKDIAVNELNEHVEFSQIVIYSSGSILFQVHFPLSVESFSRKENTMFSTFYFYVLIPLTIYIIYLYDLFILHSSKLELQMLNLCILQYMCSQLMSAEIKNSLKVMKKLIARF